MEVKGTAFLARKSMLVREFGEEKFNTLVAAIGRREPVFTRPILATTILPIAAFLAFNDMIVRDLYGGDVQSYFSFGEASAEWSLREGPYKNLVASKSLEQFAGMAKLLYANYFTEGRAESTLRHGSGGKLTVELRLLDIPRACHHPYLEYAICGYFKRGLELVSNAPVKMRAVRGFTKGDSTVQYEYVVG